VSICSTRPLHISELSTAVYGTAFGHDATFSLKFASEYPSFFPEMPKRSERVVDLLATNPFIDDLTVSIQHPRLVQRSVSKPTKSRVEINAFIKVRYEISRTKKRQVSFAARVPLRLCGQGVRSTGCPPQVLALHTASLMPPDFGRPAFDDSHDRWLFDFCKPHKRAVRKRR
jgi:hypothetical protein